MLTPSFHSACDAAREPLSGRRLFNEWHHIVSRWVFRVVAKAFQALDVLSRDADGIAPVKVVGPQLRVLLARVPEHVVISSRVWPTAIAAH